QLFTKLEVPPSTAAWGSAAQTFDVLDAALRKGPWILGEKFSAADIMLGSGLNFAVRMFKMVPPRPSFDAYIDRCVARPAFQRAEKIAAGRAGRRVGKGATAPSPPSIVRLCPKWWARCALPTLLILQAQTQNRENNPNPTIR